MKKISFKTVKENMSRKEMRNIMGGSGSGGYGCGQSCSSNITCAFTPNCSQCVYVNGLGQVCVTSG